MATRKIAYVKGDVKESVEKILNACAAINNQDRKVVPPDGAWQFVEENGQNFVLVPVEDIDSGE
jgi:hypothetical protein